MSTEPKNTPAYSHDDLLEDNTQKASESNHWFDSMDYIYSHALKSEEPPRPSFLMNNLIRRLRKNGVEVPITVSSPYFNTIPASEQPEYPGDRDIERRIKSLVRWNAMAMVVQANRVNAGLGGHISTFASLATLYEVGFNHIFHAGNDKRMADLVYFQGHASPGNYSRAYMEYRIDAKKLHNFRQELAEDGGLSSYPHPYLMPDFWQFPTVSMGLGPITSIYHARFVRYMKSRNLLPEGKEEPHLFAFVGDGESDEPETLGALTLAGRESLDNLTWIVNCNLQRLDGPVRGNGKIIQELESLFRGAGWNVIKVIWGTDWDELLETDHDGLLAKRMGEVVDGEFQKYSVEPGSYARKHFFGKYPELMERVNHWSDDRIQKLLRGGHDPKKVYTAYKSALDHKGQPTVILAKTIKGYGLGEAGEGRNITHQQKKMNERELREFRDRFQIPIDDEEVVNAPFYRPPKDSPESQYLLKHREALGGFLPKREDNAEPLNTPGMDFFSDFLGGSGTQEASTTMVFVRILTKLLGDKDIGENVVPIIPDEARTFGMDALFRQIGIYSSKGQLYEPVDKESLLFYREQKDGQILEEGITEAGSMASFVAAGSAYTNLGRHMIPFYTYYSMFGFQRVGDLMWLAGDTRCRGFLMGATSGRTTLNGEGLQHQDGHSLLMASTIPTMKAYDPAFACELAVIIQDGLKSMYHDGKEMFYYITLYNENHLHLPMPEGAEEGILKGLYKFKAGESGTHQAHILGSGPMVHTALKAQAILAEKYDVKADVWSATSYKHLRTDALNTTRWNMLNPDKKAKKSYLETVLENESGAFVAVSDNMKIVADQIAPWVPGGLMTLGTDGFGRSETRTNLRRFFEIDVECTVVATLYKLAEMGTIDRKVVAKAIKDLGVDPDKVYPEIL
ncbi:MAG: pyruvate dehydrogenase (acetyl-transferring), homodimeric type [Candidatus Hinthialibacter antarcticus]|nr:pyruvate dehydrogenase (acetyl-transferring), homodimeric type [Candidatus Hinthialibacter antarcticus]